MGEISRISSSPSKEEKPKSISAKYILFDNLLELMK